MTAGTASKLREALDSLVQAAEIVSAPNHRHEVVGPELWGVLDQAIKDAKELAAPRSGRPRKITPALLEQAESLRKEGLTWREVGERLSSKPGTLRRSTQRLLSARRAAQNVR